MNRLEHVSVFSCCRCHYSTRHFIQLIHHYKGIHEFQRNFSVVCGIESCQKSYTVIKSFQSHILRKHPDFYQNNISARSKSQTADREQVENMDENQELSGENDGNHVDMEDTASDQSRAGITGNFHFAKHIAQFLLMLREMKKLPMNACVDVVNEIENIVSLCQNETRVYLEKVLRENGVNLHNLTGCDEIFESSQRAILACESLSSAKKQNSFFKREFGYIEPVELTVGEDIKGNSETLVYVPIKDTLKGLLAHDDVLACILNPRQSNDQKLTDFCDGNAYKSNGLFAKESPMLQIQLYVDDFQVSNPLGNKIKQYKITAIYFILGNLPPRYRSKLYTIQLAMLVKTAIVKKYGLSEVLKYLLTDLKSLETEGLTIDLEGRRFNFCGTVTMLVADNLAAHEISGMMESFVAHRICRFCKARRETMQDKFSESDFQLRSAASYDAAVSTVETDRSLASVYGIKSRSPLNSLDYYHVSWGIPSDIAHDIFEGFGTDFLEFCVRQWVDKGYFTLVQFNDIIETFPYCASDKVSRPTRMSSEQAKFRVKQTASQAWCLLRTLPVLIGHLVPQEDKLWGLYIQLLDIVDLVCAPTIQKGQVTYLGLLITSLLQSYFEFNSDSNVKPKAHYLIHYASEIFWFGPLVHCWTLRYEGKHNYFKEVIHRSKNHRNVCITMARRHQFLQSMYNTSTHFLDQEPLESTNGCFFPVRLLLVEIQELLLPLTGLSENVFQAKSVKVNGISYESDCCVVMKFEHDCYQFGRIHKCFVIAGYVHLLVKQLLTEEFSSHFHAYIVSETDKYCLLSPDALLSYHQLPIYRKGTDMMITLKFYVDHD